MSSSPPDYYKLLGVSPGADVSDIKKRYRELARRYHPDMNPNPDAMRKIKLINEAYHILGDADRRQVYDSERRLKQASRSASGSSPITTPPPGSSSPAAPQPQRPPFQTPRGTGPFEFNGFGRAQAQYTAPEADRSPSQRRPRNGRSLDVARLMSEAQTAFLNRKYQRAEEICREIISENSRHPVVHEVLGDVLSKLHRTNEAVVEYAYAVQLNPRNRAVQAKHDRLLGIRASGAAAPVIHDVRGRRINAERNLITVQSQTVWAGVGLSAAFLIVLFFVAQSPGPPFALGFSVNLLAALLFEGFIAGILLAFYGSMPEFRSEMRKLNADPSRSVPVSPAVLLSLFAMAWFVLSLMAFAIMSVYRNRVSSALGRVYGVTIALCCVVALIASPESSIDGHLYVLALSGNLLFPTMLLGWSVGDTIRMQGR